MATLVEMRQRVHDFLYSAMQPERPFVHTVNANYTAGSGSMVVTSGANFVAGDILDFPGGDQYLVTGVVTNTLSVVVNWAGTTSASHSSGDWFFKNPRFTVSQIDDSITSAIEELQSRGVHIFGTSEITLVDKTYAYTLNLPAIDDVFGVMVLYYKDSTNSTPVLLPFKYSAFIDSNVSTSERSLSVPNWGDKKAGDKLYFTYVKKIGSVTDLLSRQEELVVMGATVRLLGRTITPTTHEPGRRTNRGVPPGQTTRDVRHFQVEYLIQTRQEAATCAEERERVLASYRISRARRWRG